jgi:hypothetical protein
VIASNPAGAYDAREDPKIIIFPHFSVVCLHGLNGLSVIFPLSQEQKGEK